MAKGLFAKVKFPSLIKELENGSRLDDRWVRVIRQLGELGDPRAVEPLGLELWKQDQYADRYDQIAEEIVSALGRIGGEKAIRILADALDNRSPRVRNAALSTLHSLNWKPEKPWEMVKYALAFGDWETALRFADTKANEDLIVKFISNLPYSAERMAAIESLTELGDDRALRVFLNELDYFARRNPAKEDDPQTRKHTRIHAIRGIAKIRDFKKIDDLGLAISGLIHCLGNPDFTKDHKLDGDYTAEVVQALKRFKRQGFDHLVKSLQTDDANLRAARVEALKAFPGKETAFVLAELLADGDKRVRFAAARTMQGFEIPELAEPLANRARVELHPSPLREMVARLESVLAEHSALVPDGTLELIASLPNEFSLNVVVEPGEYYDEVIPNGTAVQLAKAELERRKNR